MILFSEKMKMAEIIHRNYLLIPVIRRFGIKLGFGDKTIKTICIEYGIDSSFFLTIINTFSHQDYFPEERLQRFNILEFIGYLRKTHYYYLHVQVPLIEKNIEALLNSCTDGCQSILLIKTFFLNYKNELEEHMIREEQITFPYIESLYKLYHYDYNKDEFTSLSIHYSMKRFGEEHNNVDIKLFDLQNILIKYINGNFSEEYTQTVVFELFRLEKDIRNHTRLEELILKPMVEEMEHVLKSHSQ